MISIFSIISSIEAQDKGDGQIFGEYAVERVEPKNWWVGFKNNELQLLVKHPNISEATPYISYKGVTIKKVHKADSPNYLFIDLEINESTKPGIFYIFFKQDNKHDLVHKYQLKEREKPCEDYKGFDSSDAIYLLMPDRFSKGDEKNNINTELFENEIDRNDPYKRHGGDIQGIINHIDYIENLGFTAVWLCPLLTNNMQESSYHGYAITDFYEIDPRFGSLEKYNELSALLAKKGIKLIMDQVVNHCGLEHWWMKDLPFEDWLNQQQYFESEKKLKNTSHIRSTNQDLYASQVDKRDMTDGWFAPTMPDLNQRNLFMARYLIQNSIWWIETSKLGGIRQDTYSYADKDFMSRWGGAIMTEYPNFSIVGEAWTTNPLLIAYWQKGHINKDGYKSNLKSPMDFALQNTIATALNDEETEWHGLIKIYEGLANDFAYASPKDILIFPDNHDMSHVFTQLHGDIDNTKMAISFVLSIPRIPQIYYGTEILMDDFEKPGDHGLIRSDFPGGWVGDKINAFTGEGLSDEQKDMQIFIKKILNYRKNSKAIHEGKTIHFAPKNGVYVLFRMMDDEIVVHIMNRNQKPIALDLSRFDEIGLNGKTLKNIITDELINWGKTINLNKKGSFILSTKI